MPKKRPPKNTEAAELEFGTAVDSALGAGVDPERLADILDEALDAHEAKED